MDTKSPTTENRNQCRFSAALSSALSEWILIILLLIDAFCLYLATKICRSCKLQSPCLLCSRFGYLFGSEKLGFFRDLVCDAHKLEISSFAFCHVHQKLANAREMCEICLLSFAKKMSSLETCKFFMSKLGIDLEDGDQIFNASPDEMLKVPLLRKACEVASPRARLCSCCSQPSRNKSYPFRIFQNKALFKELAYPDSPSSGTRIRARPHLPDGLSKARETLPMPLITNKLGDNSSGHLSHFRYRQLKFTSESESEVPLSDDDDRRIRARKMLDVKKESVVQSLESSTFLSDAPNKLSMISDNIVLEKDIYPEPAVSVATYSVLKSKLDEDGYCDKSVTDSNIGTDHPWKEKPIPPSSEIVTKAVSTRTSKEFSGVDASRTSTTQVEITEGSQLTNVISKEDKLVSDSDNNISSFAEGSTEQTSTSEIALVRESARLHEDIKQRLSQIPSPRWLQYPWTDISQCARKAEECKLFHSSSFHGLPSFNRTSNVELSCSETAEGSVVSEVEGEVAVDGLLKRQIEMDQKSLSILYKELEEERNASAIAANQAMAMINKLQEEKAAVQLEVMQYLRMMEEQTEYEQEALRNLNEQLTEREKEIQDLEMELECCRKQLSRDESLIENVLPQSFDSDESESEYSTTSTPHVLRPTRRKKHYRANVMFQDFAWSASGSIKENLLDFEDERLYISNCLKSLEKNVRLFSNADASRHNEDDDDDDEFNDKCSEDNAKGVNIQQSLTEDERTRHSFCSQNKNGENCVTHEMNSSSYCNNKHLKTGKRNDVTALGDEVEHLNARLEALEADRDFLERTINSLRNGKDGVQFVREIATNLRELRKAGFTQREDAFS